MKIIASLDAQWRDDSISINMSKGPKSALTTVVPVSDDVTESLSYWESKLFHKKFAPSKVKDQVYSLFQILPLVIYSQSLRAVSGS